MGDCCSKDQTIDRDISVISLERMTTGGSLKKPKALTEQSKKDFIRSTKARKKSRIRRSFLEKDTKKLTVQISEKRRKIFEKA